MAILDQVKKYYKLLPVQLTIVNQKAAQIASEIYQVAVEKNSFADCEGFNAEYGPKLEKYILYYDIGKCVLACGDIKIDRTTTDNEILANRKYMSILEEIFTDAKLTPEDQLCKEILYLANEKNEQFDGLGFPRCLKGAAISPIGKILCVADYIAAEFIDGCPKNDLLKKLKLKLGKKFDPDVVVLAGGVVENLYEREKAAIPEKTDEFRGIQVLYQPVCDGSNGHALHNVSYICLNDPKQGTIMPAFYGPIAEKNGRMMDITKFGFELLFPDIYNSKFAEDSFSRTFSVNVSTECLSKPSFLIYLKKMIRDFSINPQRLIFEINASALDNADPKLLESLKSYQELGIKLAIDNYGIDSGSLIKLQDMEFDIIKIDRSFIDRICDNQKTYEIVKNMIKMAQDLGIEVVAKGVDSEQQKTMLLDLKCFYMQGRIFGEPEYLSM